MKTKTIVMLLLLSGCARQHDQTEPSWPKIRDTEALIQDAHALCVKATPAEIDRFGPEDWPSSVAALEPVDVLCDSKVCVIALSTGAVARAILIAPERPTQWPHAEPGQYIEALVPGIFRAEYPMK